MKKKIKQISFLLCILFVAQVMAQPVHTPIAAYTNHKKGYVGYSLYPLPDFAGNDAMKPYDIAVTSNYHFHSGTTIANDGIIHMVICKKNATTGAPISSVYCDFASLVGLANSNYVCNGMLMDESRNRIYVFGKIHSRAVIACYDMSTLTLITSFSSVGAQKLSNVESEVIDAVLTFDGNFAVLLNEKDANNKNFMSIIGITPTGGWMGYDQISNANYECYGKRFRKYSFSGLSNTYYIAGNAINASSQTIPMLWEVKANGIAPLVFSVSKKTSDSFTSPVLGYGTFIDCDFLPMQIVTIGNTPASQGIWAKYNIPASGSALTPISTFKNGATLPGTAPVNNQFTRCLVDPDGYTIVTSINWPGGSMGPGRLGYITPSGNSYVITFNYQDVHKVSGLMKDNNGNIITGGCDVLNKGISTVKFTSYAGYWGGTVNKQQAPEESQQAETITFNTFPNPVTNQLIITFDGGITNNATIQIIDMSGKKVMEQKSILINNQQTTLDIGNLNKGVYFVRVTENNKSFMKKMVKQ